MLRDNLSALNRFETWDVSAINDFMKSFYGTETNWYQRTNSCRKRRRKKKKEGRTSVGPNTGRFNLIPWVHIQIRSTLLIPGWSGVWTSFYWAGKVNEEILSDRKHKFRQTFYFDSFQTAEWTRTSQSEVWQRDKLCLSVASVCLSISQSVHWVCGGRVAVTTSGCKHGGEGPRRAAMFVD